MERTRVRLPLQEDGSHELDIICAARAPWVQRGNPLFTIACQVSSSSAARDGAEEGTGMDSPAFRVKPVALLRNLCTHWGWDQDQALKSIFKLW